MKGRAESSQNIVGIIVRQCYKFWYGGKRGSFRLRPWFGGTEKHTHSRFSRPIVRQLLLQVEPPILAMQAVSSPFYGLSIGWQPQGEHA
jgi:hypothetical protein